jgi:hypothetical protein
MLTVSMSDDLYLHVPRSPRSRMGAHLTAPATSQVRILIPFVVPRSKCCPQQFPGMTQVFEWFQTPNAMRFMT